MFLQRPDGPVLAPADFMLELLAPITYLHRRDVILCLQSVLPLRFLQRRDYPS